MGERVVDTPLRGEIKAGPSGPGSLLSRRGEWMKKFNAVIIFLCCVMGLSTLVFARAETGPATPKTEAGGKKTVPKSIKGAKAVSGPFRVKNVTFKV